MRSVDFLDHIYNCTYDTKYDYQTKKGNERFNRFIEGVVDDLGKPHSFDVTTYDWNIIKVKGYKLNSNQMRKIIDKLEITKKQRDLLYKIPNFLERVKKYEQN